MIRALYSAASGMVAQTVKQDVIANNIANAKTVGFKRLRLAASTFAETLETQTATLRTAKRPPYPNSPVCPCIVNAEQALDTSQGSITPTGHDLDLAIEGPGSFEVVSGASGKRLTRGGSFMLSADGELRTMDGAQVQGRSGAIRVPKEGKLEIGIDGIIKVDGAEIDQIKIVNSKPGETTVKQGCLEEANVNIISEMTDMITNMRSFEANQRVIQSVDSSLNKLINEVGKV